MVALSRLWRIEVVGREHIPPGPFVLAPIHRSYLDTPFVSVLTRRRLHYMGKEEVFNNRAVSRLIRAMGTFPVRRGKGDREALRIATSLLVAGEPVVVFPEGTRREGPVVETIHEGPAFLSVRSQVPIVPVGIGGSEVVMGRETRLVKLAPVKLVVGEPIHPPAPEGRRAPRRAVRDVTDELHEVLQDLFDRAQELAGTPNPPRPD
ncbi:MAG: lysophospholipid acyltransferase family protein [Actinomycetota bacterium]|nr:lysophospholipid acyltransferase family protein [Actinomycetota bacterium]